MPKKFKTENTKATEARVRKAAVKENEKLKKEQEIENEYWKDEDKNVLRKQQRKEDKDKKKQEVLERKAASQKAYEEEMSSIKASKVVVPTKVTRAEISEKISGQAAKTTKPKVSEELLEENLNRIEVEGEARSIDEAISVLSVSSEKLDRHPEKRLKAAYDSFEELQLPRLKAENPNLRLSQLKQLLKKDWMKSPENPLNQRHLAYNFKS